MDDNTPHKLSTSALAKELGVATQQLFGTLKDFGWIRKLDDGWALTGKGEFEGGEYVHSKRYGRYVVWPPELLEHPLLQALEDQHSLSATALGKAYSLNAREVNRLLAELGWIKHSVQGWELTGFGEQQGGVQLENEHSGTFYVVWPEAVQHDPIFKKQLAWAVKSTEEERQEDDLFAQTVDSFVSVDGHQHKNSNHLQVCQWLYSAGLAHACNRRLPFEEEHVADFYLPASHIYIECWDDAGDLAQRMTRKTLYEKHHLPVIDLQESDWDNLDEVLTRQLRKFGVRVV
jgi:hypothetical protein